MTTLSRPDVDCEQTHSALPVSDVAAAADFYTKKLGFTLAFTWGDPPAPTVHDRLRSVQTEVGRVGDDACHI